MKWPKIKRKPKLTTDETPFEDTLAARLGYPTTGKPLKITPVGLLPVEAQVFLRVMGEDLSGARDLLRHMPRPERHILLFWIEQTAGLVYEVEEREGI